jgi:ATPase family protein associated with various cellular activities (AAA)
MVDFEEMIYAPSIIAMNAFVEPFRGWMENTLGCLMSDSVTLELETQFGQLVAADLLKGVSLDQRCCQLAEGLRSSVIRWELPPGISPRIELNLSRDRRSSIISKESVWNPKWKETPIALWLSGLIHPVIAVSIPYISLEFGIRSYTKDWIIIRQSEATRALNSLRSLLAWRSRRIEVIGGRDITLPAGSLTWDSVVLDPSVTKLVKEDFEFFLRREAWFKNLQLPFRRGYLFHGPPGNGKTTAIRVMACHPALTSFTLDFSNEELRNDALTELFDAAAHAAPSLVIFEDLDRLYGKTAENQNRTHITLQHLLNCLDGLGNQDGTIVVATANNPTELDCSILRRPGRFDRIVPFRLPSVDLRREYLRRFAGTSLATEDVALVADKATDLSYAQIREVYIMAGQMASMRQDEQIRCEDFLEGIRLLNSENTSLGGRSGSGNMGFGAGTCEARP